MWWPFLHFGDFMAASYLVLGILRRFAVLCAQIHGHDFACMAVLPGASPPCYAVGSEEKVIRVLEAPQAFEQTLALARGHTTTTSTIGRQVCSSSISGQTEVLPPSASVPSSTVARLYV